jgi:hypothetical protein
MLAFSSIIMHGWVWFGLSIGLAGYTRKVLCYLGESACVDISGFYDV